MRTSKRRDIVNFISEIRGSHVDMVEIFTKGSCLNFFLILRKVWPEAQPYYNINHIVTKIEDRFFDVRGDVTNEVKRENYIPFFSIYPKKGATRAIKQMLKANFCNKEN